MWAKNIIPSIFIVILKKTNLRLTTVEIAPTALMNKETKKYPKNKEEKRTKEK